MLSLIGWLNAISFLCVLIFESIFGLFFVHKSRKARTRRLKLAGILLILVGMLYLGYTINFFYYLLTSGNLDNLPIVPLIIGFSIFLANLAGSYFGMDLWLSDKIKKIVLSINILAVIILGPIFLLNPEIYFTISNSLIASEELVIYTVEFNIFVLVVMIFISQQFFFLGFGAFYKSLTSKGVIRRKYFLLGLGLVLAVISLLVEFLLTAIILKFSFRFVLLATAWMWYLALREEKIKEIKPKVKEVKIEGDLFRLYEMRPKNITEQEVMFHKERKLCLVCKGKVEGFTFICPECSALYCQKCATALSNLDNACWVCYGPINKDKLVKKTKPDEPRVDLEKVKKE